MSSSTFYELPVLSPSLKHLDITPTIDSAPLVESGTTNNSSRSGSISRTLRDIHQSAGVLKKRSSRHRSASRDQAQRLRHSIALESIGDSISDDQPLARTAVTAQPTLGTALHWHTPKSSPQALDHPLEDPAVSFEHWTFPTPPGSDAGLHPLPPTAADDQASVVCGTDIAFEDVAATAEMSSLDYLLPGQYSNSIPHSSMNSYNMDHSRSQSVSGAPSGYPQTASTSPSNYQGRVAPQYGDTRHMSNASSYAPARRVSGPYDSPANSDYTMPSSNTIPPLGGMASSLPMSSIGSPAMAVMPPQYGASVPRHANVYDSSYYGQQQAYTAAPAHPSMYAQQPGSAYAPVGYNTSDQMSRASSSDLSARSQNQRSKAQCWEHGCNGRQFSTFSNLLRHQREKSGTAAKSYCPKCGAEFTRTTARNGHLLHDKCTKVRRQSEER